MTDQSTKIGSGVGELGNELRDGILPRHALRDRLKALGIGFGAAFMLGLGGAHAATTPDAAAMLTSTNPAVDAILKDGPQLPAAKDGVSLQQVAYYRWFRRYFQRWYNRY